ncbi:MAG: GDSL family lipase [Spirochaetes bacterium]|nr:GDSL family lipase [Spirochaetota bacterium]
MKQLLLLPLLFVAQTTYSIDKIEAPNLRIVALGDSITWGYPNGKSWTELAAADTGMTIINRGVNGETLEEMYYRMNEDVVAENPDVCIIMGGTNDVFYGNDPQTMMNIIEQMADDLRKAHIVPVIGLPIPLARNSSEDKLKILRKKILASHLTVIDFAVDFPRSAKNFRKLLPDGIHPAADGKRIMAERLKKEMPRVIAAYFDEQMSEHGE